MAWRILRNTALVLIAAGGALCAPPVLAAEASGAQKGASKAEERAPGKGASLPSLAEILAADERLDGLEREVRKRFGDGARLKIANEAIAEAEAALAAVAQAVDGSSPGRVQMLALFDLSNEVRGHAAKLQTVVDQLGLRVRAYDADLDRLNGLEEEWGLRIHAARQRKAPADLQARVERVPARIADLAQEVTKRRDASFEVLDRTTRLLGRLHGAQANASDRREQLLATMGAVRDEPLWRAHVREDASGYALVWATTEYRQVRRYVAARAWTLTAVAAAAFALGYALVAWARAKLSADPRHDPDTDVARMLFRHPVTWALLITLVVLLWRSPDAPLVYVAALLTLIVLGTVAVVLITVAHRAVLSLCTLAAALVLNWFQVGLDALPFSGRIVLIVQCAAVATALFLDLRRGRIASEIALLPKAVTVHLVQGAIVVLLAAIVSDIFGYIGAARQMRDGVLRMLGLGLALNLLGQMLYALVLVGLRTPTALASRIVQHRSPGILATTRRLVRATAIAAWIAGTLLAFQAVDVVDWIQEAVAGAKIEVGTVTLSASAVLLCIAILFFTYLVVRTARLVLEVELLPRMTVRSATSFVISAATRYLLTVSGLILAMAALGIDFSRVTLLVSAIGVGIGFGLQNVVNNFVSGLLLLGERVINVGDTVEVGGIAGVVRRIGVRSSTVRTGQGAEVIVPNSNLTSKEVVNYTLTDRHRRLDIAVSVKYGSDPDDVVRVLLEVAKAQPEVLAMPAPAASFVRFGDSSLEFRLQAWIANYERGAAVETALRTAILSRFKAEAIEMPSAPAAVPAT